jgi:hypothetical protein
VNEDKNLIFDRASLGKRIYLESIKQELHLWNIEALPYTSEDKNMKVIFTKENPYYENTEQ